MTAYDWMRAGPAIRGNPSRDRRPRRSLIAIGLLAILAFSETGCRSGGCGNCGFLRRTSSRIFNRSAKATSAGCCGDTVGAVGGETIIGDAPMSYSSSPGVVVSPSNSIPSGITPGPTMTLPADSPTSLEPIIESTPKARSEKSSSNGIVPKTSYNSPRPANLAGRPRVNNNLAQTSANNPVPASRSARGSSVESQLDTDSPLDRLPPLDLPAEVTERPQTPPVAPVAEATSAPNPAASDKGVVSPAEKKQETKKEPEKSTGSNHTLPPDPTSAASAGASTGVLGIERLVAVDLKLAGGSTPTLKGLDWLADKGYKTLLDLRESTEVDPSFSAEVEKRGIRYIPMPMNVRGIDAAHVARFNLELSMDEARPLFFFDSDGTRPGALWYVRRITKDNVDPQIARGQAEEIGLKDKGFWLAAKTFVDRTEAAKVGQLPANAELDSETTPASMPVPQKPKPASGPSASTTIEFPTAKLADAASTITENAAHLDPATSRWLVDASAPFKNRAELHPLAAVMMTGLTVPLAYWTRSMLPVAFTKPTASLAAAAPRPKLLPDSSGE